MWSKLFLRHSCIKSEDSPHSSTLDIPSVITHMLRVGSNVSVWAFSWSRCLFLPPMTHPDPLAWFLVSRRARRCGRNWS